MWRFFYTSLLLICQPLILCFIGLLSVKSPRYRQRLAERYGFMAMRLAHHHKGSLSTQPP